MPRKRPLPKQEIEIGRRLRDARRVSKCSRGHLAHLTGVGSSVLKRIELGRVPLRYGLGRKLCQALDLSQAWLAKGIGLPQPRIWMAGEIEAQIPETTLFSEAFERFLCPTIGKANIDRLIWGQKVGVRVRFIYPLGLSPSRRKEWILVRELQTALRALPHERLSDFLHAILEAADHFCESQGLERKRLGLILPRSWEKGKWLNLDWAQMGALESGDDPLAVEKLLTAASEFRKTGGAMVVPTLQELLKEVRELTEPAGMKARLAAHLGVHQARITDWLNAKYAPSGSTILALLRWVQDQRQKEVPKREEKT